MDSHSSSFHFLLFSLFFARREISSLVFILSITLFPALSGGGLEVVKINSGADSILVSGFSDDLSSSDFGMIAFAPETGTEMWRRQLYARPTAHDCALVDVNGDGSEDCLIVGEKGLMAAVDPSNKGRHIWSLHHHIPLVNLSLPRRLPDLDGDGISELVATCAVTLPSGVSDRKSHIRTNIVLISGVDGAVIGRPFLVEMCTDLATLNVSANLQLQFDCLSFRGGKYCITRMLVNDS